jgi:membrane fusion protein (multidrug efflux system)
MGFNGCRKAWTYLKVIGFGVLVVVAVAGCSKQPQPQGPGAVEVKAVQVVKKDTPVTYGFVGQVVAKEQVPIQSKVAGYIVKKMVNGGAEVTAGQPLFQIDRRQYEAALLTAKSQLAQSEAVLAQASRDLARNEQLWAQAAVAQQVVDDARYQVQQDEALVNTNRANVQLAEDNLQDTLIVSPVTGRIDINDLSAGTFVQAGATTLATVSSEDPVYVQFAMSENEYLHFSQLGRGTSPAQWLGDLKLVLSDGSTYPLTGKVDRVDRGLGQDTGTLSIKALFANPQKILVPGMFARIVAQGEIRHGALLIPQRALQQMLGKTFVTVVGKDDKAESRPITTGPDVGDMVIVESGLSANDRVVVDGFQKAPPGTPLKVVMISPDDILTPAKN